MTRSFCTSRPIVTSSFSTGKVACLKPLSRSLREQSGGHWSCQVASGRGAFGLVDGRPTESNLETVATLAARYSREDGQKNLARWHEAVSSRPSAKA